MLLAGLATILLASIVLTNPFTEKLFILMYQPDMWKDHGID